ncbi:ARL14 effector protein isoform X1 [Neodiprion lecontei]|uniref:ARL14 effector protein isoform X1 n=1 Tax=Neodiprion lecontei TaxID=441921 RepID=A0ABM3GN68_NEOLC|nr:ARL14 effector protein-like isoform X1 [Neodiprion pinetum]XP_046601703.1 ARL14 effector protein isoform X1 [Neodiprion lecontei]
MPELACYLLVTSSVTRDSRILSMLTKCGYAERQLIIRTRTRSAKKAALSLENGVQSFLKYFDPERSEREKRKLNRRLYPGAKKHVLYDEKGIFFQTGEDLCDCLERSCLGCHFPCPKCKSTKCGHECRSNRKWAYESIENEGSDVVIRNPVLKD